MSLVAYSDDSDDDDRCDDGPEYQPDISLTSDSVNVSLDSSNVKDELDNSANSSVRVIDSSDDMEEIPDISDKDKKPLFSSLPAPKATPSDTFELEAPEVKDNIMIMRRNPVKITVPSILEFDSDEKEMRPSRKFKTTVKGSRLFSILPPPKTAPVKEANRPLVPNVLTKRAAPKGSLKSAPNAKRQRFSTDKVPHHGDHPDSGDDSGGEGNENKVEDFFSLGSVASNLKDENSPDVVKLTPRIRSLSSSPIETSPPCIHPPTRWTTFLPPAAYDSPSSAEDDSMVVVENAPSSSGHQSSDEGKGQLSEEAFKRLGGPKHKRQRANMEIIDINEDTILPDSNEWFTKQLTVEKTQMVSHSHRKAEGPTSQQKKKHQITYLAFQAKENELELKNQWSQNRISRKQTQSKYGF